MDAPRKRGGQRGRSAPAKTLFGGLLRCGLCGGAMVAVSPRYYGCAAHKDRGPAVCSGTFAPRAKTDNRLVAELQTQVLAPDAVAKVEARVRVLLSDVQARLVDHAVASAARVKELTGEIRRLVDAILPDGFVAGFEGETKCGRTRTSRVAGSGSSTFQTANCGLHNDSQAHP